MEYIDTGEGLAAAADELADAALVGADAEAAGYHRYSDRVCLVQISTRDETYIIDALALPDPEPLRALFEDPDVEVIIHDATFDLRLFARDFGIRIRGLFDTATAAQFLGERKTGLSSLLETYLGVRVAKKHQLADWAERPLPSELIEYAAEDTRHLPRLRDRMLERLREMGRAHWAEEEFRIQEAEGEWTDDDSTEPFRGLKGAHRLRPRALAALRELYEWRDDEARSRDRAPFRIVSNKALVELAKQRPESKNALARVPKVSRRWVDRYGAQMLAAIDRARALPTERLPARTERPRRQRPDPETEQRFERLRAVRTEVAEALGLDRGFLMPRSQLETIARENPGSEAELAAIEGIRDWQIEAIGANIVAALRTDRTQR